MNLCTTREREELLTRMWYGSDPAPPELDEFRLHEAAHAVLIDARDLWRAGWRIEIPSDAIKTPEGGWIHGAVVPHGVALDQLTAAQPRKRWPADLHATDPHLDEVLRHSAAERALMHMAGVIAMWPYTEAWSNAHAYHASSDLENTREDFAEIGYAPRLPWPPLHAATIEAVDRRWGAIEAVASALAANRDTLIDTEVRAVIAAAPNYRNPYRRQHPIWRTEEPADVVAHELLGWRCLPERIAAASGEAHS